MINRIINPRVAAVAFAASALIAAPAIADPSHKRANTGSSASVHLNLGNGLAVSYASGDLALRHHHGSYSNRGYHTGQYGYRNQTKQLRKQAIRACRQAVRQEARYLGFDRAKFEEVERVRQVGPRGFIVRAEFEFEGRRRDFDRDVTCEVRRGHVVDINNLPRPRGYRNSGYRNDGYRGYGYHSNDQLKGGDQRRNY